MIYDVRHVNNSRNGKDQLITWHMLASEVDEMQSAGELVVDKRKVFTV